MCKTEYPSQKIVGSEPGLGPPDRRPLQRGGRPHRRLHRARRDAPSDEVQVRARPRHLPHAHPNTTQLPRSSKGNYLKWDWITIVTNMMLTELSFIYEYRVAHLVADLGWVDLNFCVPYCPLSQPLLPNFHQPEQIWAGTGSLKIQVYPTQVRHQMGHLVRTFLPT